MKFHSIYRVDANHNGVSEPWELMPLAAMGIRGLGLDYESSPRVDRNGNAFRYRARVYRTHRSDVGPIAYDVFFLISR